MHHLAMPSAPDRRRLRTTFDDVADLYDRSRPRYPTTLFDDLVGLADIPKEARILEIGCGTGQATVALAERGFQLTGIELGARLAEVARRRLRAFPAVEVVTADFEQWNAPEGSFDAVAAFTAFHWLDPATRYEQAAQAIREGGALAIVETRHVRLDDADPFWLDVQADYDILAPTDEVSPPPHPDAVGDLSAEIEATPYFRTIGVRRYLWDVIYSADSYLAVLDTYSNHRALNSRARGELYHRIRRRIEARPGQTVSKTYLATLNVAHRVAAPTA